jgi:hypothetical protein
VKYELGSYIPEDGILHSCRRENLSSYKGNMVWISLTLSITGSPVDSFFGVTVHFRLSVRSPALFHSCVMNNSCEVIES